MSRDVEDDSFFVLDNFQRMLRESFRPTGIDKKKGKS
jgi:hypothetical protein